MISMRKKDKKENKDKEFREHVTEITGAPKQD